MVESDGEVTGYRVATQHLFCSGRERFNPVISAETYVLAACSVQVVCWGHAVSGTGETIKYNPGQPVSITVHEFADTVYQATLCQHPCCHRDSMK